MNRRDFLKIGVVGGLGLAGAAGFMSMTDDSGNLGLTSIKLEIPRLAKHFSGLRIGLITDIHLGIYMPMEWLQKAIRLLADNEPDLVLLGGDYIWFESSLLQEIIGGIRNKRYLKPASADLADWIYSDLAAQLKILKPPLGVYSVLGNHDRWRFPSICLRELDRVGCNPLVNKASRIEFRSGQINLYGVDDYWTGRPILPPKDFFGQDEKDFNLLLLHNPDYLSFALANMRAQPSVPVFDLALAGHTHGGQIKLPIIGAPGYHVRDLRFKEGLFQTQDWAVFTSRGLGVVEIPWRINCPPEVVVLEIA